jgi:hypothetical protein
MCDHGGPWRVNDDSRRNRGRGRERNRKEKRKGEERETKRNEKHAKRAECEAKTCNYACPGVCQNRREEVPVVSV